MFVSKKKYEALRDENLDLYGALLKKDIIIRNNKDTAYHLRTERTEALLENDSLRAERQELLEEIKSLNNVVAYLKATNQILKDHSELQDLYYKTCNPGFAEESAKLFKIVRIIRLF